MTTAASSRRMPDLRNAGTHVLRLGDSIQRSKSKHMTAVHYNHRPNLGDPHGATAEIEDGGHGGAIRLTLKDGKDTYEYNGQTTAEDHTYVLIPEEGGDGFVLERLDTTHTFNLTSAPWEEDAHKLAQQYTLLELDHQGQDNEDQEDELFGDDAGPDDDNPFDFRHYIQSSLASFSPNSRAEKLRESTPLVSSQPPSRQATPLARPARKPASALTPNSRKAKPTNKLAVPKATSPGPTSTTQRDVPTVRLERRGTVQLPRKTNKTASQDIDLGGGSDDDDGLVLDGIDPLSKSRRNLLALNGQHGDGPISLRSAASSPGSNVNSPALGHSSARPSGLGRSKEDDIVMDDEDDEDETHKEDDGDVEDLALGSPMRQDSINQGHRQSLGGGDDDDMLEQDLLLAMELGEDDGDMAPTQVEEEEESEEE